MAEIVRLTPEIDWENNDEFYPIDLRGAITVFGRTKRGRPVCITFTESGHDLQFDSGQIHNSFSLKVLKDIGGTNNIMESVGDGEPLLHYIRQRMSRPEKGLQKRVNLMQQKTNSDLSRHYLPRQLRHLILQEYLSGVKTARQLSEEHGIPMSTIHKMGQRWKAKNSCSFVSTPNPYPIMSRVTSEEASELLSENKALRRRLEEALLRLEGYEIMGDILQEEYGIDLLKKSAAGQSSVSKKDTQQ